MANMTERVFQQCVIPKCSATFSADEVLSSCTQCTAPLDVRYDWSKCQPPGALSFFDARRSSSACDGVAGRADASGVWRFRELLPLAPVKDLVTIGEGRTLLQRADGLANEIGMSTGRLHLQYEGFNPSGSFKDNGMAAAFTMARMLDRRRVACASTGNTSASLAMFAGLTKTRDGAAMEAIVFVGDGRIAPGKLAQALDHGARTVQIRGDFDTCMELVRHVSQRLGLYVMNSVNPFRLEGQKSIIYRVLEGLGWEVPDWIVLPGGNLGNTSAFGKALLELHELGLISRLPRLAVVNADGASTLYQAYHDEGLRWDEGRIDRSRVDAFFGRLKAAGYTAKTVASAIEIGRPVNLLKALRSLETLDGVVCRVPDAAILDGKALVGRFGFGCEPASGASVAGLRSLLEQGVISRSDRVVCVLTGHALKDAGVSADYHAGSAKAALSNPPVEADATIESVISAIGGG